MSYPHTEEVTVPVGTDLEDPLPLERPHNIDVKQDHNFLQIKILGKPALLGIILLFFLVADLAIGFVLSQVIELNPMIYAAYFAFLLTNQLIPYALLSSRVNHYHITVRTTKLGYWQSPFSFFGGKIVNTFDILNFSLEKQNAQLENHQSKFTILMHLKNGKVLKICQTHNLQEALYIEKILEDHLGLLNETTSSAI